MKKTAQLLKNHIEGKKTKESLKIVSEISEKLKKMGFKAPFKFHKIAITNKFVYRKDQKLSDLIEWIGQMIEVKTDSWTEDMGEHFGTPVRKPETEVTIIPETIEIDFKVIANTEYEQDIPQKIRTVSSNGMNLILKNRKGGEKDGIYTYDVTLNNETFSDDMLNDDILG